MSDVRQRELVAGNTNDYGRAALRAMIAVGAAAMLLLASAASAADGDKPQTPPAAGAQPAAGAKSSAAPAPTKEQVAAMVLKLGAGSWREREEAQKDLTGAGAAAVDELEKALKSDDAEVRQRAESTLQIIRKNLAESASEAAARGRIWKSPVREGVGSPAASGGGVVCFQASDGTLRAVDAATGKAKWTFDDVVKEVEPRNVNRFITGVPTLPTPVVSGGIVYVAAQFGRLYAVDLAGGQAKWKSASNEGFAPPAVAGGRVYAAGTEKDVQALDAATGKAIWTCDLEAGSTVRPAVGGGTVYVAARDNCLYAIDTNSGQKKKLAENLADLTDLLVMKGGEVVVRTSQALVCLDPSGGKEKWTYALPGNAMIGNNLRLQVMANNFQGANGPNAASLRGPVRGQGADTVLAYDGTVYATGGGLVHAVDAAGGKLLWTYKPESKDKQDEAAGPGGGGPAAVVNVQIAGAVVIGGQGRVFVNGMGMASGPSLPAIAEGTMYVASPMGLHAVDLKTRQELWRLESNQAIVARPVAEGGILYYGTTEQSSTGGVIAMAGGGMINARPVMGPGAIVGPGGAVPLNVVNAAPATQPAQAQVQADDTGPALNAIKLKPAAAAK